MNAATPLDADEAFFRALLAADHEALDDLLTADFALVDVMAGQLVPREVFVRLIASGDLTFFEVVRDPSAVTFRHRPGLGVVTGRTRMTMCFQGSKVSAVSCYTHVFITDDGRWRLLAAQGTPDTSEETFH